jgi:hypothetical protein
MHEREALDETIGRPVRASLLVWARAGDTVVMHRLVARTLRDRLQAADELAQALTTTSEALRQQRVCGELAAVLWRTSGW